MSMPTARGFVARLSVEAFRVANDKRENCDVSVHEGWR
jgi:hypothetical protein